MPLGIVVDEEFESEVSRLITPRKSDIIVTVVDKAVPGRTNGDNNVPAPLRNIIGEEALVNGRKAAIGLAEQFGISHDSVDAYKNGATSTATFNQPDNSLTSHLDKVREAITTTASDKLKSALESITPDKLKEVKVRDASGIAKDMSVIIKNMEPDKEDGKPRIGPNYIFYSPRPRQEEDYETIEANE